MKAFFVLLVATTLWLRGFPPDASATQDIAHDVAHDAARDEIESTGYAGRLDDLDQRLGEIERRQGEAY